MIDSILFKSLGMSTITGVFTEGFKALLLYNNVSAKNVLLYSMIFTYTLGYFAQRRVFEGGRIFGLSLLKYCAVTIIVIQITSIFLGILEKNNTIKSLIEDKNITEPRRKIYKYILINFSILTIFFFIVYPLRKYFIFVKNKETDYMYSYMLYALSALLYLYTNNYFDSNILEIKSTTTFGNSIYYPMYNSM